ncbi:hypothetical protein MMC17_009475 [Xylographa soralifera]|nr:hypothetical protein [Xylographa soralifera]
MSMRRDDSPKPAVSFGRVMRSSHFNFAKTYNPLNHGSYGTYPTVVRDRQRTLHDLIEARPDPFIRYTLPELLIESRAAVAPLLGVSTDEVVFVPNATTGVNTVLRSLVYEPGDVILHFSTAYGACEKTIEYVCESTPAERLCIVLQYPIEDKEVVQKFREAVETVKNDGRKVKIAMFDTVLTFPGVRMPWEALVDVCKDFGVLSLVDAAHGIGHIDLTRMGQVGPDFFTSNCYKWFYVPRGCAIFHVPTRNQHLIRSSLPTSWGWKPLSDEKDKGLDPLPAADQKSFAELFAIVATTDTTPYICVLDALKFRENVCGGEERIRQYCQSIVQAGAHHVAQILDTDVMNNKTGSLQRCCFANVRLPLTFAPLDSSADVRNGAPSAQTIEGLQNTVEGPHKVIISIDKAPEIVKWIRDQTCKEFDTAIQTSFHAGNIWVRFSGQIYIELADFDRAGYMLKGLCDRIVNGEGRQ